MNNTVMNLSIFQLSIAYIFVLILLIIFKSRGIRREKQILIATVRMTLQLTLMGYVLMFVFNNPSWYLTLIMIGIMIAFAIYNSIKRVREEMSKELKRIIAYSMMFGALATATFFIIVVLKVRPWFNPQYFIPISGMIVGNSMTGIALGANKLCSDMEDKRVEIENSLMLGASPAHATREIVNGAFDSAILPTMNNMLTMGIVSLPGMMTGQILSGTFPITAIKYQIGIMLAILGSTALATVFFVTFGYRTFFTKDNRLK
ncbi:ABC transporter permease [Clostridium saccharobutylicum]|uniref:TIGR00245 family protein n=1 Tax=Clostridium saccharobutylicum DSM 13864 TaxID=1345695 RepID=U5MZD7_CLOSA|nr:iron export ABC transporter permease subunit FetB [Clostridium saccharobutylicum]AGX45031.1 TIGR00245 family protein [Clostridium saccharobutylicum DSM 13864]AQR92313.1 putative iron export permease protein FetB [Clostridium saccharobutylicum]AQS02215.1 putative iron export permease protein FetB [Clostridium saccharobutylicum]AQS11819.1 putative iron export permease protein FetB [Clostridium saccharobutylicum]AQS16198.1 putative iron export permease protein FetB [Clostridium saccharobutylic